MPQGGKTVATSCGNGRGVRGGGGGGGRCGEWRIGRRWKEG